MRAPHKQIGDPLHTNDVWPDTLLSLLQDKEAERSAQDLTYVQGDGGRVNNLD